jgi:hypothetical protein
MKIHPSELRIGLSHSSAGELVIVMSYSTDHFAVYYPSGELYIYNANSGQVIDPLQASTVWEAFELYTGWSNC